MTPAPRLVLQGESYAVVGAAVNDVIIQPDSPRVYQNLIEMATNTTYSAQLIDDIIGESARIGYEAKVFPGGPVLNVAQYLANRKRSTPIGKFSHVTSVSALVLLAASENGKTLMPESLSFLQKFSGFGIDQVLVRKRAGLDISSGADAAGEIARCLYIINPKDPTNMHRVWEPNVEARSDYNLSYDWLAHHDVLVMAAPSASIAARIALNAKTKDKYIAHMPGPVLTNLTWEETKFEEVMPSVNLLQVNALESAIIMRNMGYISDSVKFPELFDSSNPRDTLHKNIAKLFSDLHTNDLEYVVVTLDSFGALAFERGSNKATLLNLEESGRSTPKEKIQSVIGCGDAHFAAFLMARNSPNSGLDSKLKVSSDLASSALRFLGGTNLGYMRKEESSPLGIEEIELSIDWAKTA